MPPASEIEERLSKFASRTKVAHSFGVSRPTLVKWLSAYEIVPQSPAVVIATNEAKVRFASSSNRVRFAQWLIDEGSVSVDYQAKFDSTYLVLRGTMIDYEALKAIAVIVGSNIQPSLKNFPAHLPLHYLRVYGAKAYAFLEAVVDELNGLKFDEARAALAFFPRAGFVSGRHTTDEFMLEAWETYAVASVTAWNQNRLHKLPPDRIAQIAREWVEYRIRKSRRYVDNKGSYATAEKEA
jgi:hypothetical protein